LARLFRSSGFDVRDLWTDYDGQYLMIEARPSGGEALGPLEQEESIADLEEDIRFFKTHTNQRLAAWRRRMLEYARAGKKIALWGAGSKGVSFLTTLGQGVENSVEYAVDINPHKEGTFMAGTGQAIIRPDFLKQYQPDVMILMNPVYREEVENSLAGLGLSPEILLITT
jgi:hypothetical protein